MIQDIFDQKWKSISDRHLVEPSFQITPNVAAFSHSVMSDSLKPHGQQHTRLPCPSASPRVCSNLCPLSQWYHSTISFCHPFFSIRDFPVSRLFTSSIGTSTSASVLPVNIQGWFPLGLTGLISLLSKGVSRVFSSTIVQKRQFFGAQPSLWSNSHTHTWLPEKT